MFYEFLMSCELTFPYNQLSEIFPVISLFCGVQILWQGMKMQIRFSTIFYLLGFVVAAVGFGILTALPVSLFFGDGDAKAILFSALVTIAVGSLLSWLMNRFPREELRTRDGFAVVTLSWIAGSAFGSLPYILSGVLPSFTDAFFETISGFSTTGASAITDVESVPHGILFWRALSNWLGGIGIVVMSLAILPFLGVAGMQLFKAEVSGPTKDKLTPRIVETARILWVLYFSVTAVESLLLMLGGMPLFDSVCHSFSTIATGGFSTKNASIGFYNSAYIESVVIIFMFVGSCNFSLIYVSIHRGPKALFGDHEFIFYLTSYLAALVIVMAMVTGSIYNGDIVDSLRASAFSVMTVFSTTGFATADFAQWPYAALAFLLLLMILGGCAGSTAGGLKQVRVLLLIKSLFGEIKKLAHPRLVSPIRYNGVAIERETVTTLGAFLLVFLGILFSATLVLMLTGLEPGVALSAVAACLSNEGPGFGSVGPMGNYAHLSALAKWVLSVCMFLGRLEIFTVLVLFSRAFWKG